MTARQAIDGGRALLKVTAATLLAVALVGVALTVGIVSHNNRQQAERARQEQLRAERERAHWLRMEQEGCLAVIDPFGGELAGTVVHHEHSDIDCTVIVEDRSKG